MADKVAVRLAGSGAGLAEALEKFKDIVYLSLIKSPSSAEMGHLFFADPMGTGWLGNSLRTHPSIEERLRRLKSYRVG